MNACSRTYGGSEFHVVPRIGHDHVLPNPFQLIIHQLFCPSTPCNLRSRPLRNEATQITFSGLESFSDTGWTLGTSLTAPTSLCLCLKRKALNLTFVYTSSTSYGIELSLREYTVGLLAVIHNVHTIIPLHCAMKEVWLHSFLSPALDGGEWSSSRPGRFTARYPLDRRVGEPQSRSECCAENLGLAGYRTPVVQPVAVPAKLSHLL
jgi:hypothetical protein